MTHTNLDSPPLRLDECSEEVLRQRFEALASFASPSLHDWTVGMARSHVQHYRVVFRHVHDICSKRSVERVVDIGAVPGFITVTLKQYGLNVEAVDLAPERTNGIFESAGVPWHRVDVEREKLPFDNESMDLVLFNEVLEHLRINPIFPIQEIHRVLRPSGTMVLSTPNITFPMRLKFLLGHDYQGDIVAEYRKLETVGHMGHCRLYSRAEVHRLLKHIGFASVESRAYNTRMAEPSWRRRLLESIIPEQMGDHLYVVATKKD